jgi:hypothetical protein
MTFQFGALMNGPEHDRSWAGDVRTRVCALLEGQSTGPGVVELHLYVGGTLGEPGWIGPGRPSRRRGVVAFHVGIPRAIQDATLEERLLEFAERGVDVASGEFHRAGLDFDSDGHREAIRQTRRQLAAMSPASVRRDAFRPFEERFARRRSSREAEPETYSEPRPSSPMPHISFAWSTQGELAQLFRLEELVDERLIAEDLGSVDGNEIGAGTFDLFISPFPGKRRAAMAAAETVVVEQTLSGLRANTQKVPSGKR